MEDWRISDGYYHYERDKSRFPAYPFRMWPSTTTFAIEHSVEVCDMLFSAPGAGET